MKKIKVEISPADFLDRLSVLNIKLEKFENKKKKSSPMHDFSETTKFVLSVDAIRKAKASLFIGNIDQFNSMNSDTYIRKQYLALQQVNKEIWELEKIADKTLEIYRQLTNLNDKRHRIKSKIDSHLGSSIGEEKGYR